MAEQPIVPAKLFKNISGTSANKKIAKEKITSSLLANPEALENSLIQFLSGREEHQ